MIIEASIIIPTINRSSILERTLKSVLRQNYLPKEVIVVDASDTLPNFQHLFSTTGLILKHTQAETKGAATQRNQGIELSSQPFIFFMDDDILLEESCIERLWNCMNEDEQIGGVNAMIINQNYGKPGQFTLLVCRLLNSKKLTSYAGMCIGPAWNFLPEDNPELPDISFCHWLNTTCTLYRKIALPSPVFPNNFYGYSMMEDLTLSLTVGKRWKLCNVRSARIFHDSQPGIHKSSIIELEKMELINRYYVMTEVMGKVNISSHIKLFFLELFFLTSLIKSFAGIKKIPLSITGKLLGFLTLVKRKNRIQ